MNLTAISIRRPSLIIVLFAVIAFLGIASYRTLPIEMVPKFSPPMVTLVTIYPGASPSEVENSVGKPIEEAVSSLEGIDQIQVTSQENASFVVVELDPSVDIDKAVQEIQRKVNQIVPRFPREVRTPVINKFALDELPVMRMALSANVTGPAFYDLVSNRIAPEIAQVKGVAQVDILGGEEREIKINISSRQLEQYGLSLLQVAQAVQTANLDFPTGKVSGEQAQLRIRLAGKFLTLDDIRNLVVGRTKMGSSIYLKDIADVQDGIREPEVICRISGYPAVGISIRKQGDANAVDMAERVIERIGALEKDFLKEELAFQVVANSSVFTKKATDAVVHDLLIAVLLVAGVMMLFLHSFRNAAIVLISIPTSIVSTFIVMKVLGYSLNLMSLLGLSLAIGILVDDAIVVIENIYRHLEMGKNRIQASYDGRMEIGFTAISITLIDVVVFLPIIFTIGMVSSLLRQFCVTVLASTLMSLLVSFTLVPWLTSRFGKVHRFEGKNLAGRLILQFEAFVDWLSDGFVSVLRWSLRSTITKWATIIAALGLFFASVLLVTKGYVGNAFFDQSERGEFMIDVNMPKDASLAQTDAVVKSVEDWLRQKPDVVNTFTTVGANNKSFGLNSPYFAEVHVFLSPYGQTRQTPTNVYARQTKIQLEERIAGAAFKTSPIDILGLSLSPIEIILNGPSLGGLMVFSDTIKAAMRAVPGCVEIASTVEGGNPEVQVEVNRQRLADYGLTMAQVGLTLQTAFSGNSDARYRDGDYEYPIRIQLDAFDRRSADDVRNLSFVNPMGNTVYLRQFAVVQESVAPNRLERRDRMPSLMIQAQGLGRPNGSITRDIKARLDELDRPPGVEIKYGGDFKRQQQGIKTMGFALWTSLLLVYLVMVALYDNWVYPFIVLLSIPLSLIGALLALALANENLTVFAGLGMLMLVGLVGKNAILVVDFANDLRKKGFGLEYSLMQATKMRFRPVLMTNIAMVIGLLPLALSTGAAAEWKNGLAWAIIGGLNSSMFLSLIVVPVVYGMFDVALTWMGLQTTDQVQLEE
jgi:HAE1 family hydrophobic/amphiphilic exporter-1